jgi:hypothetical protein
LPSQADKFLSDELMISKIDDMAAGQELLDQAEIAPLGGQHWQPGFRGLD